MLKVANTVMSFLMLDRATKFALAGRLWQVIAGPITLVLISRNFTPAVQGYYYTCSSLLALQTFVELSLFNVITTLASHEWAHLKVDENGAVVGDTQSISRLASLHKFIVRWYSAAALIFAVVIWTSGYLFFSADTKSTVQWLFAWTALVALAALQLFFLPFNALLEGCGQVEKLSIFRFVQALICALPFWCAIAFGGELWALVVSFFIAATSNAVLILFSYRRFFASLRTVSTVHAIRWKAEIWPLQWRLAIQSVINYFLYQIYSPLLFQVRGPEEAGRAGMTLQLLTSLQSVSSAWMNTRTPAFGSLIAQKKHDVLMSVWRRSLFITVSMFAIGSVAILGGLLALEHWLPRFSNRLLPLSSTLIFMIWMLAGLIVTALASYVRAHKTEPFVLVAIVSGIVNTLLVFTFTSQWGAFGAALGSATTTLLVTLPWIALIWQKLRNKTQLEYR